MKILALTGSPNPQGSTFLLADAFRQGAQDGEHEAKIKDAAHARAWQGPATCGYDGPCAKEDVERDAQTAANSRTAKRRKP